MLTPPHAPGTRWCLDPDPTEAGAGPGTPYTLGAGQEGRSITGPEGLVPTALPAVSPAFAVGMCMNLGPWTLLGTSVKID